MRKWGLHFLCVLILALVVAGCGSGSDNNSSADSGAMQNGLVESSTASDQAMEAPAAEAAAQVAGGDGGNSGDPVVMGTTAENTADTAGAAGFTGSDVVAGLNKKLIYRGNLTMEVEDYGKAQTEVRNMVTMANGYIIEFNENVSEYEQGGTFIMKVPASGFSSFLNNLEKVAHQSLQRSIQGQDVSEEYVDLESRLKAKVLMERQYTEFMSKATKSADLVSFANELGRIQEEIEQIKGRMRYIDQNVSFSTVELRLYETEAKDDVLTKAKGPLMQRAGDALNGSLHALSVMFQWLVVFLAGAFPVLIVAALVGAVVWVIYRRRRSSESEQVERIRQSNRERLQEQQQPEQPSVEAEAAGPEAVTEDDPKRDN
ncbi:DUF4349 domain-containing protein [Paenibacillus donghaensis]|nr:DUF4349 domain-containing protein [Paenibacillus donghaensis]